MLEWKRILVWIECDDTPLRVYKIAEEKNRVTCFIASEEGKQFSVHWRYITDDLLNRDQLGTIYLDGKAVASRYLCRDWFTPHGVAGFQETSEAMRPFQFGRLLLTDDDSVMFHDERSFRELGTIRINMTPVRLGDTTFQRYTPEVAVSVAEIVNPSPVHETMKKATTHCAKLGKSVTSVIPRTTAFTSYTLLGQPGIDFVFQYAPFEWLKAQGIACLSDLPDRRTAAPVTSSTQRPRHAHRTPLAPITIKKEESCAPSPNPKLDVKPRSPQQIREELLRRLIIEKKRMETGIPS